MLSENTPKVLLITLKTFSIMGGVEKVCRSISYAFQQLHNQGKISFYMHALYDKSPDKRYIEENNYIGYEGKRLRGIRESIKRGRHCNIVVLSHINLAPIGLIIKLLSPSTRLILWSHGIEVWRPLNFIKKIFLIKTDDIVAVSRFTAEELGKLHNTGGKKVKVIPNALDPYFVPPFISETPNDTQKLKMADLQNKYHIPPNAKIFLALTRLRVTEKNKNYDKVIALLGELKKEGKEVYYFLCGKYDSEEFARIKEISSQSGMGENVVLTGYLDDDDLVSYYLSADAFVLPSTKEGFGLAFIEAQACGLPVLAGNRDGSREAVRSKLAGNLINPFDSNELKQGLVTTFNKRTTISEKVKIQQACLSFFSFQHFEERLKQLIFEQNP